MYSSAEMYSIQVPFDPNFQAYPLPAQGVLCSVAYPPRATRVLFKYGGNPILEASEGMFPCKIPVGMMTLGWCQLQLGGVGNEALPASLRVSMQVMPTPGTEFDFGTFYPIPTVVGPSMSFPLPDIYNPIWDTWMPQRLRIENGSAYLTVCRTSIATRKG